MLLLTMPVVWIYASTQGEVSLVVLAAIALAATGVYWGLRWLLTPALVHALGTGIGPGRYRALERHLPAAVGHRRDAVARRCRC
jgi:hypothetical protein